MIALHTFGPDFALPTPSPFALRVETQMKMSGLPYTKHIAEFAGPPKGKIPFIVDGDAVLSDPVFIRRHLERQHGVDLDRGYDDGQRAVAWTVERMVEDHLYWVLLYNRWMIDENFYKGPAKFYEAFPVDTRTTAMESQRQGQLSNIRAQGMGRYSLDEVVTFAGQSYTALASLIHDKPYLLGDKPCGADASVFAHLACILTPYFRRPDPGRRTPPCRSGRVYGPADAGVLPGLRLSDRSAP